MTPNLNISSKSSHKTSSGTKSLIFYLLYREPNYPCNFHLNGHTILKKAEKN